MKVRSRPEVHQESSHSYSMPMFYSVQYIRNINFQVSIKYLTVLSAFLQNFSRAKVFLLSAIFFIDSHSAFYSYFFSSSHNISSELYFSKYSHSLSEFLVCNTKDFLMLNKHNRSTELETTVCTRNELIPSMQDLENCEIKFWSQLFSSHSPLEFLIIEKVKINLKDFVLFARKTIFGP